MDKGRNGVIFQHGNSRRFDMLFTPSKGGIYEFGAYRYDTSSGRRRTTHYYGFVHVKLPRTLPNLILDSNHNNLLGETGLPGSMDQKQQLHLEGDFDKYFTLYAPQGYLAVVQMIVFDLPSHMYKHPLCKRVFVACADLYTYFFFFAEIAIFFGAGSSLNGTVTFKTPSSRCAAIFPASARSGRWMLR